MRCNHCGRWHIDPAEIEAILEWGKCLFCEHVEADAKDAQMSA